MSSITGYRSPVNIGLGQTPITTDPDLFNELTDVYNAIHLLNEYLDQLRNAAEGGGSGQTPAETLLFNRFFIGTALQTITKGQPVCPSSITGQNGMLKGALAHLFNSTAPESNFCGIALSDATIGEDFRVGVGPGVLEIPGAVTGTTIWVYASRSIEGNAYGNGTLYITNPGPVTVGGIGTIYPMPVGLCLSTNFVLFGKFLKR